MSISLPIIKSFVSVDALSKHLERVYQLKRVRARLLQATMRDVYLVEGSGKSYVMFIYNSYVHARESIENEMVLLEALKQGDLSVVTPIETQNGDYLVAFNQPEGTRYGVLFPFVEGKRMTRKPDIATVQRYGVLLAKFHEMADTLPQFAHRPTYDSHTLLVESLDAIRPVLSHRKDVTGELRKAISIIQPKLNALEKDEERTNYGIIHGDVIPSNVIIGQGGTLTLVDFDLFGYGWRMFDIATFVNEIIYWDMGSAAETAFIQAYETFRPLSKADKASIPLHGAARVIFAMGIPARNINTWGTNMFFSDAVVDSMMSVLRDNLAGL